MSRKRKKSDSIGTEASKANIPMKNSSHPDSRRASTELIRIMSGRSGSGILISWKLLLVILLLTLALWTTWALITPAQILHALPSTLLLTLRNAAESTAIFIDDVDLEETSNSKESTQYSRNSNKKHMGAAKKHYYGRDKASYFVEPLNLEPWGGEDEDATKRDAIAIRRDLPKSFKQSAETEAEALATLHAAVEFRKGKKAAKAKKLFEHALALAPRHPDILTEYGLFMEDHSEDVRQAEKLYTRALIYSPQHEKARSNRERTLPLVEEIDNKMLGIIDQKREFFLEVPRHSPALRRAMREAYFLHVYHTVAIEGNTMSLIQTRSILETHLAVAGKSVLEHNEIMGMDAALRFLNSSLVHRIGSITTDDIKEIHRRVLGFVDPIQAGVFRETQVYVGDFVPVPPQDILDEMAEFIQWLNSEAALEIHPVELAALAHYKFVYIHPFIDGNGRTARLLANLILMQAAFPPIIIRVDDRLQYYETLQAANEGDLRPFIRFVAASTDRTLDSYLAATSNHIDRKQWEVLARQSNWPLSENLVRIGGIKSSPQSPESPWTRDLFEL